MRSGVTLSNQALGCLLGPVLCYNMHVLSPIPVSAVKLTIQRKQLIKISLFQPYKLLYFTFFNIIITKIKFI